MKRSLIFFICALCILTACSLFKDTRERVDKVSDDLIVRFSKRMFQEKGYELSALGGSELYNKVKSIEIYFQSEETFSLSEARELICDLATDFLLFINEENKQYQEDYIDYPLKTCNIDIALFSKRSEENFFLPEKVVSVNVASFGIMYLGDSREGLLKGEDITESLEEAIDKLEAEGKNYDYLKSMIAYKKYRYEKEKDPKYHEEQARLAQGPKTKGFLTKVKDWVLYQLFDFIPPS